MPDIEALIFSELEQIGRDHPTRPKRGKKRRLFGGKPEPFPAHELRRLQLITETNHYRALEQRLRAMIPPEFLHTGTHGPHYDQRLVRGFNELLANAKDASGSWRQAIAHVAYLACEFGWITAEQHQSIVDDLVPGIDPEVAEQRAARQAENDAYDAEFARIFQDVVQHARDDKGEDAQSSGSAYAAALGIWQRLEGKQHDMQTLTRFKLQLRSVELL